MLAKLTEGIWLSDGKVRAKRARIVGRQGQATMLELVLAEGKKREIRRMLSKLGHKVMSLNRIAVGPISLKGLPTGECRPLTRHEVDLLRKVASGAAVSPPRFFDADSSSPATSRFAPAAPARAAPLRPRSTAVRRGGAAPIRPERHAPHPGSTPDRPPRPRASTSASAPRDVPPSTASPQAEKTGPNLPPTSKNETSTSVKSRRAPASTRASAAARDGPASHHRPGAGASVRSGPHVLGRTTPETSLGPQAPTSARRAGQETDRRRPEPGSREDDNG